MSELIPLTNTEDGARAVMGRDLHHFLEVHSNYTTWIRRLIEKYDFVEGQDYLSKTGKVAREGRGDVDQLDHILTLDMAKELSMVQNNARGRQARRYFIECERRAQQPQFELPQDYVSALRELATTVEARDLAEKRARELEAPAKSWATMAAAGGDYSVSAAAKTLSRDPNISIGRDQLFAFMADEKWIFRAKGRRKHWEAYQDKGMNTGRLTHKLSRPFLNEKTGEWEQPDPTVRVTPKWLHELHKLLGGSTQIELVS